MKIYVVKNERLNNNLYSLGFKCKKVKDKTGKQDYVFLIKYSEDQYDLLKEAITFYTQFKNKFNGKKID